MDSVGVFASSVVRERLPSNLPNTVSDHPVPALCSGTASSDLLDFSITWREFFGRLYWTAFTGTPLPSPSPASFSSSSRILTPSLLATGAALSLLFFLVYWPIAIAATARAPDPPSFGPSPPLTFLRSLNHSPYSEMGRPQYGPFLGARDHEARIWLRPRDGPKRQSPLPFPLPCPRLTLVVSDHLSTPLLSIMFTPPKAPRRVPHPRV